MESTQPVPHGSTTDSLGVLRHRWWVVALGAVLGLAGAAGWAQTQPPVWESTTSVLVHPAGHDTNVVGGRTQGQVNLDTEAQLVRSTAIAAGAAELLPSAAGPENLGRPEELARRVSVEVPPNTSVLMITYSAATPQQAQAGSHAFAQAYLEHRERAARAELAAQATAIETKIDELAGNLTEINERIAATLPDSAAAANLESQRGTVTNQLNALTSRLDELATATVTAGTVISEARLPTNPSRPQPAIILASGTALGLVLGVGAAALAERLARRVHRPSDLTRRIGVPVLAALGPATAPRRDEIASPYGPSGRAFDRLRNEVVATGTVAGSDVDGRVIVVTSASDGAASSLAAANLAASLSRAGYDVVLVGARYPQEAGGGALTQLLGLTPAAGLSEVLAGRMPVTGALQRSPRQPRIQVITMGATATATGLLQSPALRAALTTLARQASYVVVDAPPTSASADAQSLASHAHTALLVVEQRRARLADVADAVDQLRRVGTQLLGAIVTAPPRGGRRRDAPPTAPDGAAGSTGAGGARSGTGTAGGTAAAGGTARGRPANGRPTALRPYPLEAAPEPSASQLDRAAAVPKATAAGASVPAAADLPAAPEAALPSAAAPEGTAPAAAPPAPPAPEPDVQTVVLPRVVDDSTPAVSSADADAGSAG